MKIKDSWIREFVLLAKFAKIETSRILPDLQYPAYKIRSPNVRLMLGHRLRRWPNINLTSAERFIFDLGLPTVSE